MITGKTIWKAWLELGRRLETERGLKAALSRLLAKKRSWPTNPRSIETMFGRWFSADCVQSPSLKRSIDIFDVLDKRDRDLNGKGDS